MLFALGPIWLFIHQSPSWVLPALPLLVAARLVPSLVLAQRPLWRAIGWVSAAALISGNLFALVATAMYGAVMAWNVPLSGRVLTGLLVLPAALGPRVTRGVRVPLALPMGVWAAACMNGLWQDVGRTLRCDDYLRVRPPVEIVVPARRDLAGCPAGASLPISRYPRQVWEAPDGSRYVFTSQTADSWTGPLQPADVMTGLVCETPPGGTEHPRCIGGSEGKSDRFTDAPPLNKLFVNAWDVPALGGKTSVVMTVPRMGPLELTEWHEVAMNRTVGVGVYQPAHDTLWLLSDNFTSEWRRASDFGQLDRGPMSLTALDARFDPAGDEGVVCGFIYTPGPPLATIAAFHGSPPVRRDIVSTAVRWPLVVGLPFACEFDLTDRKVYASLINLGIVVKFDYDSGRMEKIFPLGAGVRALAYDPARRRLYVANFPGGDVTAVDVDSGAERARWFVGRFPRDVRLTRDGRALLTTSTVGLLRIGLDHPAG